MKAQLLLSFRASHSNARKGLTCIQNTLLTWPLDKRFVEDVQIALAEAVNNVCEHAYASEICGSVRVQLVLIPQVLRLRITDWGRPFPCCQLPKGELPDLNTSLHDLPEGGFGWFLIRQLTKEVCYEHRDGLNRLTLVFDPQTHCEDAPAHVTH